MSRDDLIPVLPSPGEDRGGVDAEQHRATLDAATLRGQDSWAREERARLEAERQRVQDAEDERRYVAALDARSHAHLAQARSDAIRSAATVGGGSLAGLLIGGPIGAVVGLGVAWIYDRFNQPWEV